jgi:hypothetical protein
VFGSGGAGTVVTNDAAQVLHHGESERKVRWGSRRVRRGVATGSPVKADGGCVSGEIGERKQGPGIRGRRANSGKDEGGGGMLECGCEGAQRRGERDGSRCLLRGKEGGRGSWGGRRVEGGNGKEEGARAWWGNGSGGWHRPQAGGRGRRRCRVIVEGGGDSGARQAAAGCRRARQRGAALTHGPGSTVPPRSSFLK